jgi:hypothetical protein
MAERTTPKRNKPEGFLTLAKQNRPQELAKHIDELFSDDCVNPRKKLYDALVKLGAGGGLFRANATKSEQLNSLVRAYLSHLLREYEQQCPGFRQRHPVFAVSTQQVRICSSFSTACVIFFFLTPSRTQLTFVQVVAALSDPVVTGFAQFVRQKIGEVNSSAADAETHFIYKTFIHAFVATMSCSKTVTVVRSLLIALGSLFFLAFSEFILLRHSNVTLRQAYTQVR